MRLAIVVMACAVLAGCSGKDGGGNNSSGAAVSQEEPPANLTIDPGNSAVPVTLPSPTALATIPAAFQGRWGLVGGDCDPAGAAAAKGLMMIAGNRVTFYESRGDVANLRQLDPGRIGFDLPMSGEGQRWTEPTTLAVVAGGRTLVRQASGSPDRAGTFTYQRCPA